MSETAVILAHGRLQTPFAKTTHGMVRGPSRYRILGIVDPASAGHDAGALLDGKRRGIPVFASLQALIDATGEVPDVCVVGVATVGGVLPPEIRAGLLEAADAGMTLVNGLHELLSDDPELARLTASRGGGILDIRRPKPVRELRFWSGAVLEIPAPRIAVLGTDCAVGKRTTATLLREACNQRGVRAEMIYTGQTGWLQGMRYGFIFDATPNDFVCGELERAVVDCHRESRPDLILLEGQSGLRNPAGPCGSELILGGAAKGVVLQHVPGRRFYEDLDRLGCAIPPVSEEIELIRLLGAEVWALTLNHEGLDEGQARRRQRELREALPLPVIYPLWDGVGAVVEALGERCGIERLQS